MEAPFGEADQFGSVYKGWFVAPATTKYRFYISCDDICKLSLGSTPGVAEDPTVIAHTREYTDRRDWWETNTKVNTDYKIKSDWISLNEGEHYYIEGAHWEGGGWDYFSAALEIEQSDMIGHHQSIKEVQYISV
jgi:hypothetical protein